MATTKSTSKKPTKRTAISKSRSTTGSAGARSRSASSTSLSADDEGTKSMRSANSGSRSTGSKSSSGRSNDSRNTISQTSGSGRNRSTQEESEGRSTTRSRSSQSDSGKGSRGGNISSNKGGSYRGGIEDDNRGSSNRRRSNQHTTNRGNFNEGINYPTRHDRYEDDFRNDYREGSGSREGDHYGRRNYGNDWDTGRNQDRYDNERYERGRIGSDNRWGSDRDQGRSNYGSDWDAGSRDSRTTRRGSRGDLGNQEYFTENEWNRQRNQSWNRSDNQMEKDDDYRQMGGTRRRMFSQPSGKNDEGLRKLLADQLKDIYWAEKALTKAIPKLIKKASSLELRNALNEHLHATKAQVRKVEEVFQIIGEKATAKKCEAMTGLIEEANNITSELHEGSVRDAGIICAAQKVEHYEIATYGSLSTYAEILGEMEAVDILEEILAEEKKADKTLTQVAMEINWEAAEEDEDEEDDEEQEDEDDEDEAEQEEEDVDTDLRIQKKGKYSELDAIES